MVDNRKGGVGKEKACSRRDCGWCQQGPVGTRRCRWMCRESEVVGSAIRGGSLAIELQARRRARCVCRGRARSRRVGRLAAHRVANESDRTWEACGVPWLEASAKRTSDSMGWYNLSLASKNW